MSRSVSAWRAAVILPLLLGLLGAVLVPAEGARADDAAWSVKNRLKGKIKPGRGEDDAEKATDVSGIACRPGPGFPRLCLAIDDETQAAQIVVLYETMLVAGDLIPLIHDTYKGKPLELDGEGVGYADGFFYVIGSHGRARHEKDSDKEAKIDAKAAATRRVFRIALSPDDVDLDTGKKTREPQVTESAALAVLIQKDPDLARSFDQPLEDNGVTVEGVAVKADTLYAGFRGPVLPSGSAVVLSAPLATVFDGKPGAAVLHRLALGNDSLGHPRGIRDLTVDGDRMLLIAGPEQDPPKKHAIVPGDYAIYAWDGDAAVSKLLELQPYGKSDKPEALLPIARDADTLRALLLFDGPKEGAPTPVAVPLN
jgi:hypothetical protein